MSSMLADVKVTFMIPPGNYEYTKLVYKQGTIPTSYTDGTIIDVLPSDTEKNITGLTEGVTYYFVIFTSKAQSTAVAFKASSIITLPAERISVAKLINEEFEDTYDWIYKWNIIDNGTAHTGFLVTETNNTIVSEATGYVTRENTANNENIITQESVSYEVVTE